MLIIDFVLNKKHLPMELFVSSKKFRLLKKKLLWLMWKRLFSVLLLILNGFYKGIELVQVGLTVSLDEKEMKRGPA